MAKGKKSKGTTYVSKGERRNVASTTTRLMREGYAGSLDQLNNKIDAWRKGKRTMLTIANPEHKGKENSNKPFIRVEAKTVLGSPFPKKKKATTAGGN